MARKYQILLVSHLLVLGLAYVTARNMARYDRTTDDAAPPTRTKSSTRNSRISAGNGEQLLAGFLKEQADKKSGYEELKATLPVAKDVKTAAMAAITGLGGPDWADGLTGDERETRLAEVKVRVLHWMKQNPVEAMDFLVSNPASKEMYLPLLLQKQVFKEIASENGIIQSLAWLTMSHYSIPTLQAVTLDEMKAGGGLALFAKLETAMAGNPLENTFRQGRVDSMFIGND